MSKSVEKVPVYRPEDNELMGFIRLINSKWHVYTIFGYDFGKELSQDKAAAKVKEQGLKILDGIWEYYDVEEHVWFFCKIVEVSLEAVIVTQVSEFGYPNPDMSKKITLRNPDNSILRKIS